MNMQSNYTPRENFLISLLNKVIKEYKALLENTRRSKLFKIIEIVHISNIPGESIFKVQISYKNCIVTLSCADILNAEYDLNDFSEYHAKIIKNAASGKLIEFLKLNETEPKYKIASKRFDAKMQQHLFVIETNNEMQFIRSAEELSSDKEILKNMSITDVYDIAHTQGSEFIIKEKIALALAKT